MRILVLLAVILGAAGAAAGVEPSLDLPTVSDAVALGRKTGAERTRFHEPYRVVVARAPVDFVEVVTPLRRIVLEAQARQEVGDRSFGQRQALELLKAFGGNIEAHVELTFHPQNTYVGVPAFDVRLVPAAGTTRPGARRSPVTPLTVDRVPRWTPRVGGFPLPGTAPQAGGAPRGGPLHGGTLIARFDLDALDPSGTYELVIEDVGAGEEVGRATLRLGEMR